MPNTCQGREDFPRQKRGGYKNRDTSVKDSFSIKSKDIK